VDKLSESDRAAVSQSLKHSKLVAVTRVLARMVTTNHPTKAIIRRRRRYEKTLHKWLKYYMRETFPDRWGSVHLKCCKKLQSCIEGGGSYAFAMPRGGGKSSIGKGSCVYATITGKRLYVVPIGATDGLANEYLDFIKSQIDGSNERLTRDYPEAIGFFVALEGSALKCRHQLRKDGKKTNIAWRAKGITFPTVLDPDGKPYPFSGARVECRGITAAMKGMSKNVGGRIIRPDFVLPDDVQTEDDAISPTACNKIENKLIGTVLAMAGPRKRIACFMPCTVVERDDVSDRFLDKQRHSEFQGERYPVFIKWPKAQDTLWAEYATLRKDADDDTTGKKIATAFYRKNLKAMNEGAEVSWVARIRDGETSAIETAENLLIELGEQKFFAEMQQDPKDISASAFEVTTAQVIAHTIDLPRFKVPSASTIFGGHCDINRSGLHWAVAAFDQQMSPHVFDYGVYPGRGDLWEENANKHDRTVAIFEGLKQLMDSIALKDYTRDGVKIWPTWPTLILIDAGYEPGVVHRFCEQARYPFRVMPSIGRAASKYRFNKSTIVGQPAEQCHAQRPSNRRAPYAMFNACYWREVMQRSFMSESGTPGGCTLFHVSDPRMHLPFADHIIAEKLVSKIQTIVGWRWEYRHAPGDVWDWGDAMTGAWAAAALQGASTSGVTAMQPKRKKYSQRDLTRG